MTSSSKHTNTILIVDDEEINRGLLKEYLSPSYSILEASSGNQAIEQIKCAGNTISLILLDLIMPDGDGFDVLNFMNEFNYIETIPVIVITVESSLASENIAFEKGACDFISKPFRPVIVQKRVRNMIDLYERTNHMEQLIEETVADLFSEMESSDTSAQKESV